MTRSRLYFLCLLLLWLLAGSGLGQECRESNFIAVDFVVIDFRPCYFFDHGNDTNAFIRADALAGVLGANLTLEGERLVFEHPNRTVSLAVTTEIRDGLQVRPGALVVDGKEGSALPGIAADGEHYVAIGPVVKALGAEAEWDGAHGIIFIELPEAGAAGETAAAPTPEPIASLPVALPPEATPDTTPDTTLEAAPEAASSAATSAASLAAGSKRMDGAPRVGLNHDSGFTRVVLDLPAGVAYAVAVGQTQLLLTLDDMAAQTYTKQLDDLYLKSLHLYPVDGGMALRLEAAHDLSAAGQGFKVGLLPADNGSAYERLFVDFGPELRAGNAPFATMTDADLQGYVQEAAQEAGQETVQEVAVVAVPSPRVNPISVVIDPGHGGHDGGAAGQDADWHEKQVVLAISLKLRDILRARGVEVVMTREGDTFLELAERADMATNDRNVFVSIHANGADTRSASGIETYVFGVPLDNATLQKAIRENAGAESREVGERRTQEALEAANSIAGNMFRMEQLSFSKTLAEIVQSKMVGVTGWVDRGVKENAFAVLRSARTPAILVEVGFMTNPEEGRRLATELYQMKLAQAIADGILEFLDLGGQLSARR